MPVTPTSLSRLIAAFGVGLDGLTGRFGAHRMRTALFSVPVF